MIFGIALSVLVAMQGGAAEQRAGTVQRSQRLRWEYAPKGLRPHFAEASKRMDRLFQMGKQFFGTPHGHSVICSTVSWPDGDSQPAPGYGVPYTNIYYLTPFYYDEGRKKWMTDETSTELFQTVNGLPKALFHPLAFDPKKHNNGLYILASPMSGSTADVRLMDGENYRINKDHYGCALITTRPIFREVSWTVFFKAIRQLTEEDWKGTQYFKEAALEKYKERLAQLAKAESNIPEDQRNQPATVAWEDGGLRFLDGDNFGTKLNQDHYRIVQFTSTPGANAGRVNFLSIYWSATERLPFSKKFSERMFKSYPFEQAKSLLSN